MLQSSRRPYSAFVNVGFGALRRVFLLATSGIEGSISSRSQITTDDWSRLQKMSTGERASLELLPRWLTKGPVSFVNGAIELANNSMDMAGGIIGTPLDLISGTKEISLDDPEPSPEPVVAQTPVGTTIPPVVLDDLSDLSVLLLDPYAKVVLVWCGSSGSMANEYRALLKHSLSTSQFLLAQFYHQDAIAQFQAFFVCGNGKDAAVMRDNQKRYHPMQRVRLSPTRLALVVAETASFATFCLSV
jgi:hypothetical protein